MRNLFNKCITDLKYIPKQPIYYNIFGENSKILRKKLALFKAFFDLYTHYNTFSSIQLFTSKLNYDII